MTEVANTPDRAKRMFLTVSLVIFRPDPAVLKSTLLGLDRAFKRLGRTDVALVLIQNCETPGIADIAAACLTETPVDVLKGHGNIGFGRGHNLALPHTGDYHLILNPDIEMAVDALVNALDFLESHDDCGLVTPWADWPDGTRQYLCKRFPAVFDLVLRGFAPGPLKRLFSARLARYEMSNETNNETYWDPPIVSGCFMMFRGAVFRQLVGFDPRFFLYFEDFDLALRAGKICRICYVPAVRVIHEGGHAARKGLTHIKLFARSARLFYRLHGIRIL